jgi:hypothetical protein
MSHAIIMNLISIIVLATVPSSVALSDVTRTGTNTNRVARIDRHMRCDDVDISTRRETLQSWLVGAATISTEFLAYPNQAMAFPNKISNQYDDRPKQRGSKVGYNIVSVPGCLIDA